MQPFVFAHMITELDMLLCMWLSVSDQKGENRMKQYMWLSYKKSLKKDLVVSEVWQHRDVSFCGDESDSG